MVDLRPRGSTLKEMALRSRVAFATLVLGAALSLIGMGSSGASVKAGGKVVSASLTRTSFPAAQAKTVKLVYKLSPASKHFGYLLSLKQGTKWVKVRSVSKTGRFKGSFTLTVIALFGSKSVKVGQYRIKLSADANSLTRKFTISGGNNSSSPRVPGAFSKTSPPNGATGQASSVALQWSSSSGADSYEYCVDTTDNNDCDNSWLSTNSATSSSFTARAHGATYYWQVRATNANGTTFADAGSWFSFANVLRPTDGFWLGSGSDGVISYVITFTVTSSGANVTDFGVTFDNSGCGVSGGIVTATSLYPVASGSFSSTTGSPTFSGSFDSSTTAHGTSRVTGYSTPSCGTVDLEPASWTATWHSES